MATNAFQSSVTLNNSGAACIRQGQFQEAIGNLSLALKSSKEALRDPAFLAAPTDGTSTATKGESDNCCALNEIMIRSHLGCDGLDSASSTCCFDLQENFVYQSPIEIPPSMMESPIASFGQDCSVLSTVIVFNLALAHHMAALHAKSNVCMDNNAQWRLLLQRATKLYQCSLRIMEVQALNEIEYSDAAVSPFFLMATLNNLTQVHVELDEHEEAITKCQKLLSLLYMVENCSTDDHSSNATRSASLADSSSHASDEYECFFRAAFSLMFSQSSIGAPAA